VYSFQNPEPDEYHLMAQIGFYSPNKTLHGGFFYHLDQTFRLFVLNMPRIAASGIPSGKWEEWNVDGDTNELKVGVSEHQGYLSSN